MKDAGWQEMLRMMRKKKQNIGRMMRLRKTMLKEDKNEKDADTVERKKMAKDNENEKDEVIHRRRL